MSEESERLKPKDIVVHFKHELDDDFAAHVYHILCFATHSETREKYVVYQHLKDKHVCVRPYDMFMSEVDHEKYPAIKQHWRFEKIFMKKRGRKC